MLSSSTKNSNKRSIVFKFFLGLIVVISVLVFILLSLSALLVLLLKTYSEEHDSELNKRTYEYKSLHLNPKTNEKTHGFVSLIDPIAQNDFRTFFDEVDGYSMISNFGAEEYICTGSCFCNNERRYMYAKEVAVSKGIYYLLVAASSLIAVNLAKEYFSDECVKNLEKECPAHLISSKVTGCEEPMTILDSYEGNDEPKDLMCSGKCLANVDASLVGKRNYSKIQMRCKSVTLTLEKRGIHPAFVLEEFIAKDLKEFCTEVVQDAEGYWDNFKKVEDKVSKFCRPPTLAEVLSKSGSCGEDPTACDGCEKDSLAECI